MSKGSAILGGRPAKLRRRSLLIGAGVLTAAAVLILVLLLTGVLGGGGGATGELDVREVSVQELRDFAGESDRAVYWAGDLPGRRIELSETSNGNVFVRYLTGDAVLGDGRPAFTTVGTYPLEGAFREVQRRGRAEGMEARPAPGGGLAVWSEQSPTSVYLGYPGSDLLVEVYDPAPQRARALALSGEVGPVR